MIRSQRLFDHHAHDQETPATDWAAESGDTSAAAVRERLKAYKANAKPVTDGYGMQQYREEERFSDSGGSSY